MMHRCSMHCPAIGCVCVCVHVCPPRHEAANRPITCPARTPEHHTLLVFIVLVATFATCKPLSFEWDWPYHTFPSILSLVTFETPCIAFAIFVSIVLAIPTPLWWCTPPPVGGADRHTEAVLQGHLGEELHLPHQVRWQWKQHAVPAQHNDGAEKMLQPPLLN